MNFIYAVSFLTKRTCRKMAKLCEGGATDNIMVEELDACFGKCRGEVIRCRDVVRRGDGFSQGVIMR